MTKKEPVLLCDSEFQAELKDKIKSAQSVCLTTHVNPDGDGLCACLAVKRIFRNLVPKVEFVVDDLELERYDFLHVQSEVITLEEAGNYDLVLVIDLHDSNRLGTRIKLAQTAKTVLIIDHHEIKEALLPADFAWIDPSLVCTGWMVHYLFQSEIANLTSEDKLFVGKCLYTTLLNDTNNFVNSNTNKQAFELAAKTVEYGANPAEISESYLEAHTAAEMKLIGTILLTLETMQNGKIAIMHCTREMLQQYGLGPEATSNLTRLIQNLKGVEAAVFVREESSDYYRLSLRSKTIDVNKIAVKFGGGGHIRASGCHLKGSLTEVKQLILNEIMQAIAAQEN